MASNESPVAPEPEPRFSEGRPATGEEVKVLRTLEQQSDVQLDTCGRLITALQKATEALNGCGAALQREVTSSLPQLSSSFALEPGDHETTLDISRSILTACETLGASLLTIAATLTGDLLTPLVELRRAVTQERQNLRIELERLEQREVMCCEAMAESVSRKEKVSGELQERLQQSQAKTRDRSSRMVRWIMKKTSKAEGKLQAAAHAQTAAVEELAGRLDQLALVQTQRHEVAEAFSQLLRRVASRRGWLLQRAQRGCAVAWGEGARVLTVAFDEALREAESPPATAPPSSPSSPAKAARASVPPLRLAELPSLEPEEAHVMNTASMASGSSMGSGEILNRSESSVFDAEVPPACGEMEKDPGGAASERSRLRSVARDVQQNVARDVSFDAAENLP